jgi:hypothetical protein
LLGDLLCGLRRGAAMPQSAPFREVETMLAQLAGGKL